MEKIDLSSHSSIVDAKNEAGVGGVPDALLPVLDQAIDSLNGSLEVLEERFFAPGADGDELFEELTWHIHAAEAVCREVDRELASFPDIRRQKRAEFRERTHRWFSKSYFMNRARVWPQGYPGDYRIIENAYRNLPLSDGVGLLLDRYFLSATLAVAIRERRARMREIVREELRLRRSPTVLNVGCGPCRELVELTGDIRDADAKITCVDFDSEALTYAAERASLAGIGENVEFRRYNALRMVSSARNLQVFGKKDIIYTIGLLDYLTDDVLVRLIRAMFDLLARGGTFVAVFKDCERYETEDYHWLVDWDGFLQRTAEESRALIRNAGIPDRAVSIERDRSGVILFYRIRRVPGT